MGKLAEFLKNYDNQNTRGGYSAAVYSFIDHIYGKQRKGQKITKDEKEEYEQLLDHYFDEDRDHKADLMGFVTSLQTRPPLSARQTFTFTKEFLASNNIELKHQDLKRIRFKLPKGGSRTIEKDLDIDTIRSLLQHMDIKGRTLVLVLASSGMRIAEVLSVKLDDVKLKEKPAVIQIRGENSKTGDNRITFISSEAVQAVQEWLKVRDAYIKSSQYRNNGFVKNGTAKPKAFDDNRLFPFSDNNASLMWDSALKKAGFFSQDATTNRKQLHYHMFRKFFISQLSLIVSKEVPEVLAGHAGYLTGAYRRYTKATLAEQYLKAEHLVTIQTPKEIKEIESEFKAKMQTHSEILESIVKENIKLKDDMYRIHEEWARQKEIEAKIENHPIYTKIEKLLPKMIEQEFLKQQVKRN